MSLKHELRLGNYIKQKGHPEHLKVMAILEHDVMIGDGESGRMLSWNEVEPIEATLSDFQFYSEMLLHSKKPFIATESKYIHDLQNDYKVITKKELLA